MQDLALLIDGFKFKFGEVAEFSNDGKKWVQRKLQAFDLVAGRQFKTLPNEGSNQTANWVHIRKVQPVKEMTIEEIEKTYKIKVKVN